MSSPDEFPPRVFSDEEIEMFLSGDRRQIDRHILYSLNRLANVLIPHVDREAEMAKDLESVGGFRSIKLRADYVDSLIKKNNRMGDMMDKVAQSGLAWALVAFLGFLSHAVWQDLLAAIKGALKVTSKLP